MMNTKQMFTAGLGMMCGAFMWALVTVGQDAATVEAVAQPAAKAEAAKVDPQAEKVLKALAAHIQVLDRFQCEVVLLMTTEMEGMKQEITTTYAFALERPNKLALRYVRGMAGNTIVCDGKKLVTYAGMLKRYEEREAPKTLEDLFQSSGSMVGNMLFLDNLLRADVYTAIMDGVKTARLVGKEQIDGRECDHLAFTQEDFDWDLWVTTGSDPVVLKAQSDMTKGLSAGMEMPEAKGMKMIMLNRLSNWQLHPEFAGDTFTFKPPEGAKKADTLFESEDEEQPEPQFEQELKKLPMISDPVPPAGTNATSEGKAP